MKTRTMLSTLALLILGLFLMIQPGCTTTPNGGKTVDWQSLEPMFEVAAYTGTKVYLLDNPDKQALFQATCAVLDALIADPQVNAVKLVAALQSLPIKELKDPKASIIVEGTVVLWNAYKDRIPVGVQEQANVVRPLVVRIRNGMGVAVGLDPIILPLPDTKARIAMPPAALKTL